MPRYQSETMHEVTYEIEINHVKFFLQLQRSSKYFIIYQESKKRKNKANFIRKYMKYFINFLKNVKFNAVHSVIHKTFAVFGCPKVACSRDGALYFFCYSLVNNALSSSRADARETV